MKDQKTLLFLTFLSLIFLVASCTEDDDQAIVDSYFSQLSGIYDVEAKMLGPDGNSTYNCADTVWYGQVRWTAEHEEEDSIGSYRIDTRWNSQDIWLEDPSMGSYYQCFTEPVDDPSLLPNGLNGEGSLRLKDVDGRLYGGVARNGERPISLIHLKLMVSSYFWASRMTMTNILRFDSSVQTVEVGQRS